MKEKKIGGRIRETSLFKLYHSSIFSAEFRPTSRWTNYP